MKRLLLLINLLVCFAATSQTTLERGDIMVLGVNSSTTCSPYTSNTNSAVYVIPLVDVTTNTTIDITDNGYYRVNPNRFGTTEGTLRFTRKTSAGTVSAGTVIALYFINYTGGISNTNNNLYVNNLNVANPDWTVTMINNRATESTLQFNFNTASDQIFLMQGGNWNHISSATHNAEYTGRFLFSFNSKRNWAQNDNDSEDSALPGYDLTDANPALYNLRQYHFSPHTGGFSRSYYSGPTTATSKYEWFIRILNSRNWTSFTNCNTFINNYNLPSTFKPSNPLEIIEMLGSETVCKDDVLNITIDYEIPTSNFTLQTQYEWFERNTPGNTGGTSLGVTTRQLTVPTGTTGTRYYYCMIRYRLSWTIGGAGAVHNSENIVPSGFFEVTVNPNPITSPVIPL